MIEIVKKVKEILGDVEIEWSADSSAEGIVSAIWENEASEEVLAKSIEKSVKKGRTSVDEILKVAEKMVKKATRKLHKFEELEELEKWAAGRNVGKPWHTGYMTDEADEGWCVYEYK